MDMRDSGAAVQVGITCDHTACQLEVGIEIGREWLGEKERQAALDYSLWVARREKERQVVC